MIFHRQYCMSRNAIHKLIYLRIYVSRELKIVIHVILILIKYDHFHCFSQIMANHPFLSLNQTRWPKMVIRLSIQNPLVRSKQAVCVHFMFNIIVLIINLLFQIIMNTHPPKKVLRIMELKP